MRRKLAQVLTKRRQNGVYDNQIRGIFRIFVVSKTSLRCKMLQPMVKRISSLAYMWHFVSVQMWVRMSWVTKPLSCWRVQQCNVNDGESFCTKIWYQIDYTKSSQNKTHFLDNAIRFTGLSFLTCEQEHGRKVHFHFRVTCSLLFQIHFHTVESWGILWMRNWKVYETKQWYITEIPWRYLPTGLNKSRRSCLLQLCHKWVVKERLQHAVHLRHYLNQLAFCTLQPSNHTVTAEV
jgi:hypothetical protein